MNLRLATVGDLPALHALIARSVRALSRGHYSEGQIESALQHVFGPDTRLIHDGTYFVVETDDGTLAGCGGWSRRRTIYGGDQMKTGSDDDLLRPDEPARVRAFFVEPHLARGGVATLLLTACADAANAAGHRQLALASTLPGEAFYRRQGFTSDERFETILPDGTPIAFVRMSRHVAPPPSCPP